MAAHWICFDFYYWPKLSPIGQNGSAAAAGVRLAAWLVGSRPCVSYIISNDETTCPAGIMQWPNLSVRHILSMAVSIFLSLHKRASSRTALWNTMTLPRLSNEVFEDIILGICHSPRILTNFSSSNPKDQNMVSPKFPIFINLSRGFPRSKIKFSNINIDQFFISKKLWNVYKSALPLDQFKRSYYRTRAIIGRSWLEAALEYKPYIRPKVTVHKWSLEMG